MDKSFSQSIQDYLKYIYELTRDGQPASTNDLSARLNIAPASATGMMQKLASHEPPLVDYRKHQGVTLTEAGQRVALEVIRHHRLLESWLVQSLGYSWDEVHEEACRLEHVISEEFEARMDTALGHPTHDPHGEPIPGTDLQMPERESMPLSSVRPSQTALITRVDASDPALLRHLDELGLVPGTRLEVRAYSTFDDNLTLILGDHQFVVGQPVTKNIYVELSK